MIGVPREITADDIELVRCVARCTPAALALGWDDAVGAGCEGLWLAALRFDPASSASWATFARWRIRGAILDEARRMDYLRRSHRRGVSAAAVADAGPPVSLHAGEGGEEFGVVESVEEWLLWADFRAALDGLPGRAGAVVRLCAADWSQVDVAALLGVDPSRVSQLRREGLTVLGETLGREHVDELVAA